jgi:hypothetical protein
LTARAPASILIEMEGALGTAAWWSYANADRTALTAVVVVVALAAVAYVGRRLTGAVRERKRR